MSGLSLEIIDNECEIDELCRSSIELVEHIRNFFLVYKDRLSVLLFRKFAIEKGIVANADFCNMRQSLIY